MAILHEKSCCFLLIICMKNASQKLKTDEILAARALFVICTRVKTLHSCYMKNATVFSQSDARNFFMYVISAQIGLVITNHVPEFCFVSFD